MATTSFLGRLMRAASRVYPEGFRESFAQLLKEADLEIPPRVYMGTTVLMTLFAMVISFIVSQTLLGTLYAIGITLVAALLISFMFYLFPLMSADNRAKHVEKVLPDAFFMIAANIRAGMTVETAILASAKPEFGPLEQEIRRVSTKTFAGIPLKDALKDMGERVRSKSLKRGLALLIEGNALGGQMASLLYEIGQDMRSQAALRREINTATMMYAIFIVFSTILASPILFATSVYYSTMSASITEQVSGVDELPPGAMTFGSAQGIIQGSSMTPEELRLFAIAAITTTTFGAAFTLAQIRTGKLLSGIRYVPLFVVAGLGMFFGALFGLDMVFSDIV